MTDETTAKIRAKGLNSTGVTEDLARRMYANGGHYLAIVDLKVARTSEDLDKGSEAVELVIDAIEPVIDGKLNGTLVDHVRDIQAALYRNRKLQEQGEELPLDEADGPAPSVADVVSAGEALLDHTGDDGPTLYDPDNPSGGDDAA